MKILTILGARPQFIKAAAVSREISKYSEIEEIIVHTGQHYDANMSDIFFDEMKIPKPNYFLDINGLTHGAMTGQMIIKIEEILISEKPDLVLVYGDTNSTLSAAISARKLNLKLVHVEAGLRNFDFTIPEDVNRVLTDRISNVLICSTQTALNNLKDEGFDKFPCKIFKTGDLMADVFYYYSQQTKSTMTLPKKPFILCTVHRASNTTIDNIHIIATALNKISLDMPILFPIHPRTKKLFLTEKIKLNDNIILIDPIGYLDMVHALNKCKFVITDSGGLQREAYLANKKSLLLMNYTPWEELVDNNFTVLSENNVMDIVNNFNKVKQLKCDFNKKLYGEGNTASEIINILLSI